MSKQTEEYFYTAYRFIGTLFFLSHLQSFANNSLFYVPQVVINTLEFSRVW